MPIAGMGLALPDLRATSGTAAVEAMCRLDLRTTCVVLSGRGGDCLAVAEQDERPALYWFFPSDSKEAAFVSSGGYDSFLEWDPCAHRVV
jgi:hypothetical protein